MGQAKNRGTFEQRKADAVKRNEELAELRSKMREASGRSSRSASALLASGLAMAASSKILA